MKPGRRCCCPSADRCCDTSIERAFAAFVERFGDFKPPEHNLLGAEITESRFEPQVGGHIYDRAADGSVCE